ncbi:MAG: hypothetical protein CMH48_05440 [Muricauda sp.]|nr:hypothetical protein [Allomuricauda sp.]MAU27476.1 hypothetical protein [Allomuricauda sp.]MBC30270.1 hypothetical protein [Allomuricauda sp.]|tara:strand:- start:10551 stop:11165 length:615 start_codon:yes stop_codon:yes gene_type:complete
MTLKSHFLSDLEKEKKLAALLDGCYQKHLRHYDFIRVHDVKRQRQGVDVIFRNKKTGKEYFIDEKAQLDYINEDLPTFAFELLYVKDGGQKQGWFFDKSKKTDFYALATAIFSDEAGLYTSCKITLVNRQKLISLLVEKGLSQHSLRSNFADFTKNHGKSTVAQLNEKTEGYLYFSKLNKAERPLNLILKLDFLKDNGLAKRLV